MGNYVWIEHESELRKYLPAVVTAEIVAVDTETTGLNPHQDTLRLIQIAVLDQPVLLIDCKVFLPQGLDSLREIFSAPSVKVFQNAKFDLEFLLTHGIQVSLPLFDTMLAAQLMRQSGGPERADLYTLVKHYLGKDMDKQEQQSDWGGILSSAQKEYAAEDAAVLLPLRQAMIPFLKTQGLTEVARLEFACVRALAQAEFSGIRLDQTCWSSLLEKTELERARALERIYEYVGRPVEQQSLFGDSVPMGPNPDSNLQIIEWLKEQGILVDNTTRHTLSQYVSHPMVAAIIQYRHATKALSSFLSTYPDMINSHTRRLHPQYNQIGAWSGRMSCGKPNIQQIPREPSFRRCFAATADRCLIMADYSQIELRVAAEISRDERMIQAYNAGEDLHRLTASLITGIELDNISAAQRQAAKAVNFGLIYGMGATGLQEYARETYGTEMTPGEATIFRNRFFDGYAGIARWHYDLRSSPPREARTLSGRRHVYGENAGLSVHTNIPVQGGAADILKQALGSLVDSLKGLDALIIAVVHDEIILETRLEDSEWAAIILKRTMEEAGAHYLRQVPVVVDVKIGSHWGEK